MGYVTLASVLFATQLASICALSQHPRLLLISFDGFRYDLLNEDLVPNIYKFAQQSAWFSKGVRSQYITYTAPNHMSIATGLFEESHGILSNYFVDSTNNKTFDYFNSTKKDGVVEEGRKQEWYFGEPIWLTNERGGGTRKSATLYWPNGEATFPIPPHKPRLSKAWTDYRNLSQWMSDVDEMIELFTREDDPYNLILWYIAEPDHTLHSNGFKNGELKKMLQKIDNLFAYFVKKFEEAKLFEKVTVILTADHGHAEIIDEKHVMCIPDYIEGGGYSMGDHMIYPSDEDHAKAIYKNLSKAIQDHGFDVNIFMKEDFDANDHYKTSTRVGRIILEPEIGSALSFSCNRSKLESTYGVNGTLKFNSSTHGQHPDRPEMHAFLVVRGPNITTPQKIDRIPQNIDLYGFMCSVLKITPAPNNGTMTVLSTLWKRSDDESGDERDPGGFTLSRHGLVYNVVADSFGILFFLLPSVCIVLLLFFYICRRGMMSNDPSWALKTNGYRPLFQADAEGGSVSLREPLSRTATSERGTQLLNSDNSSEDEF